MTLMHNAKNSRQGRAASTNILKFIKYIPANNTYIVGSSHRHNPLPTHVQRVSYLATCPSSYSCPQPDQKLSDVSNIKRDYFTNILKSLTQYLNKKIKLLFSKFDYLQQQLLSTTNFTYAIFYFERHDQYFVLFAPCSGGLRNGCIQIYKSLNK